MIKTIPYLRLLLSSYSARRDSNPGDSIDFIGIYFINLSMGISYQQSNKLIIASHLVPFICIFIFVIVMTIK